MEITFNRKRYTQITPIHNDLIYPDYKNVCWAVCKKDAIPGTEHLKHDPPKFNIFKNHLFYKEVMIIFENGKPCKVEDKYDHFIIDTSLDEKEEEMRKYELSQM